MEIQIPPREELTELAKRYGEDPRGKLKGTKKSDVTPVDPLPPAGPALSVESWEIRKLIEATQRRKLVGFTARELKAMGAFAYFESPKANNLLTPLHPVFRNWESSDATHRRHNPMLPLGNGRDGFWELFNPLVEAALRPCLQLATQFIENCHMWTWWDTICFGELRPIYPTTLGPYGEKLYSVYSRDPVVTHEERERTRERFIELASKVTWGLTEGIIDPCTGRPSRVDWQGITQQDLCTDAIRCYLDVSKIDLLMRTDLSAGERLILELAHAMWRLNNRGEAEPCCNNEVTIELGYSLINHLVKGRDTGLSSFGLASRKKPLIAYIATPYPNIRDKTKSRYPCLGIVESMKHDDYFPVPIEYFERIQQQDFWNHHVQVFGTGSVHMGPLVHGRRYRSSKPTEAPPINDQQIFINDYLGEEDVAAVEIENRKWLNAGIVLKALETTTADQRSYDEEQLDNIRQGDRAGSMIEAMAARFNLNPLGWADELIKGPKDIEESVEQPRQPARFSEIATFLINHRRILAIDTMVNPIPELAFWGHIDRLEQIKITREELREFLIYADFTKVLFTWEARGLGLVSRRNEGWGVAPFEPVPLALEPPVEHQRLMRTHMAQCYNLYTIRGLGDIDEDLALYYVNHDMSSDLNKVEYDILIDWCEYTKNWWTRGPPGIVRCTISKKSRVALKKQQKEKKRQEEEKERARRSLGWKKMVEEAFKTASKELGKVREKRGKEHIDPDAPNGKGRKIEDILKGIEAREKAALAKGDEGKDAGGPMDLDPESF